jgi:hypothetical protein
MSMRPFQFALSLLACRGTLAINFNTTITFPYLLPALTGSKVSYLITGLDFANSLIFLLGFLIIKLRVSNLVVRATRKLVSAADFSVMVFHLPQGRHDETTYSWLL